MELEKNRKGAEEGRAKRKTQNKQSRQKRQPKEAKPNMLNVVLGLLWKRRNFEQKGRNKLKGELRHYVDEGRRDANRATEALAQFGGALFQCRRVLVILFLGVCLLIICAFASFSSCFYLQGRGRSELGTGRRRGGEALAGP